MYQIDMDIQAREGVVFSPRLRDRDIYNMVMLANLLVSVNFGALLVSAEL